MRWLLIVCFPPPSLHHLPPHQVVPAFDLHVAEAATTLPEILRTLPARVASAPMYKFTWWPHTQVEGGWGGRVLGGKAEVGGWTRRREKEPPPSLPPAPHPSRLTRSCCCSTR